MFLKSPLRNQQSFMLLAGPPPTPGLAAPYIVTKLLVSGSGVPDIGVIRPIGMGRMGESMPNRITARYRPVKSG